MRLEGTQIVVDEKPFCVWELDQNRRNHNFIKNFDPYYFRYIANMHNSVFKSDEESENHQYAALSIRLTYSHALETFFAFLFASLQAPDCLGGWLKKYSPKDLENLIQKVSHRKNILTKIKLESISWVSIAKCIFQNVVLKNSEQSDKYKKKFGLLWKFFSKDFTNDKIREEYNSLKHGFRITPGGFGIAIGLQDAPDKPAPPERMQTVGYSKFGSSFPVEEKIRENEPSFRIKRHSRNWEVENLVHGVNLISISLFNIQSYLRIVNSIKPSECRFDYPSEIEYFEEPWKRIVGVNESSFDMQFNIEDIPICKKEDVIKMRSPYNPCLKLTANSLSAFV